MKKLILVVCIIVLTIVIGIWQCFAQQAGVGLSQQLPVHVHTSAMDGGKMQVERIVFDYTVPSTTASVNIPGLNCSSDGGYYIEIDYIVPSATKASIRMTVNGDNTVTNYYRSINGGSVTNDNDISAAGAAGMSGFHFFYTISLQCDTAGYSMLAGTLWFRDTGGGYAWAAGIPIATTYSLITWSYKLTTNITSITFTESASGGMSTNSRIRIWKRL